MSLLQSVLIEGKENFLDKLDVEQKDFLVLSMEDLMLGDEKMTASQAAHDVLENDPEYESASSTVRKVMANQLASFFVRHQSKTNKAK